MLSVKIMIVFTSNRKHEGSKYEVYQVNVSSTSSLNCIVFTSTELIHYDSLVTVYHSAFHELIKQGQSLPSDEIVSFPKTHEIGWLVSVLEKCRDWWEICLKYSEIHPSIKTEQASSCISNFP